MVHPYQARVSTIDHTAKQLAQLAFTGPNWPYALVQLNGDAHHVPLPNEGHLSVMAEGSASSVPYGRICQLEVCQLLSSGFQIVYLEGINGCQVPVRTTLPESLSNGMTMLEGESTFLQVDLSQSTTQEQDPKAPFPGGGSSPTLAASPASTFLSKVEGQSSMTMEVSELLSWTALDTSGLASGSSTPKRPGSLVLATPLPFRPEDSTRLVNTSSQMGTPEDEEMDDPMLEEIHASPPLSVETLGPSREPYSVGVVQLQEETNKSLGHLLVTRSALNAQWRK